MPHPVEQGIWDTHHHIFDPKRCPYSATRHLTPPQALPEQYLQFRKDNGISYSVLVHGLSYGNDCSSLKLFLHELDPALTRGVAVIGRETTDDELNDLHSHGVRGIRLDLYREGAMHDVYKQRELLQFYADRIRHLQWSISFLQLEPMNWELLAEFIPSLGVNVIVDHHALMKAQSLLPDDGEVLRQSGFTSVLKLLAAGNFWIKLSAPYRCSDLAPDYHDMRVIVKALIEANPERLIWGSDWPHTPRMKVRSHEQAMEEVPCLETDDAAWLRSLRGWMTDAEWRLIMYENPAKLYGW